MAGTVPFSGVHAAVPRKAPAPPPEVRKKPEEQPESSETPARRDRRKLYLFAALGGLAIAGAAAVAVSLMGGKTNDPPPASVRPAQFATGDREELFNRESILGWSPVGGPAWTIEEDEEKTAVITGQGGVARRFRVPQHFRVILGLDLHKAASAEVVVATADGPPASAKHWSIRVSRADGAVFGTRDGEKAAFQPLGAAVPVPTARQLEEEGRRPYTEVKYERAGGKFRAWYRDQLLGEIDDDGKLKSAEVRVQTDDGPVRIDTAAVEELVEKR
jgi:hypothetical protein